MSGIWEDFAINRGQLMHGLLVSLQVSGITICLGLLGGLVLAILRMSRNRSVRLFSTAVVEIGRGTPALVLLQVVYNGIPVTLAGITSAGLALALTTAVYSCEIIRGGLQAVPEGEVEAAAALGMRRLDSFRDVVIPQGLRIALPPLLSFCIIMFQATSLAFTIAVPELMSQAKSVASSTFHYFNLFIIAAVMYGFITISGSVLTERVERRLSRHA